MSASNTIRIDSEAASPLPPSRWSPPAIVYLGLLAAWIATAGSLYLSEVIGWIPCTWCWYQRIAMYPAAVLMTAGIARRDRSVLFYTLLLAIPGALASLWHIGIQKVPAITLNYVCKGSVPCSTDSLWQLGIFPQWVTIPMLALTAFVLIIGAAVVALIQTRRAVPLVSDDVVEGLPPVVFALTIAVGIGLLFGISGAVVVARDRPSATEVLNATPTPVLAPSSTDGAQLFAVYCAGCHVAQGGGLKNLRADFVVPRSEAELVEFIKAGRAATVVGNFSGQEMPKRGGQVFLSEQQLVALAQYVKAQAR